MSKFFKALENADRERGVQTAPPAAEETTVDERPAAAPVEAPRRAVEPPPRVVETAPRRQAPPEPVETPPPAPAVMYGAPIVRESGASPFQQVHVADELEPEPGALDDRLVSLLEPTSAAAEQYRTVRLALENFRRERGTRLVAISSPGRGEGKTVSAINLAGALGQSADARVVLVEADLRHPRMAGYLGLPPGRGLSTYLLDPTMPVEDVIQQAPGVAFQVILAGPPSSMPYELLTSPRLSALFAMLRERFDFVLIDTPPVMPFPDVGILRDLVDGFVLVVRANRTPREMLRDSLHTVGRDRTLGLIFNDDDRRQVNAHATDREGWRNYIARPLRGARVA